MQAGIRCGSIYVLTSVLAFGSAFLASEGATSEGVERADAAVALARFDAAHYRDIVTGGYRYDPTRPSEVAFFPGYPAAAWLFSKVSGMGAMASLLLTSNAFLAGSFLVFGAYMRRRKASEPRSAIYPALLAFGLLPPTFFFRMAYSESAFLFFCILSFYAMQQEWPYAMVAVLVGLTTACRPVGVALLLPFMLHLWRSSCGIRDFGVRCVMLAPVACWGILAFMAFQYATFGDAFAFVRTQQHWAVRVPTSGLDKWSALLSWEPIWLTFDPTCPESYWKNWRPPYALFNCQFMNPVYFVGAALLVGVGVWWRWLTSAEVLLSIALLAIPYVTKAYEYGMHGHGRFAAAVFPVYIVAGRLLAALPRAVAAGILAVSGFFMAAYAALFATGYPFF